MPVKDFFRLLELVASLIFDILPRVERELLALKKFLESCPPSPLREQAETSIKKKRFHCQGGAVFCLLNPPSRDCLLPLIVSFQTISDYLDNLCDRVEMPFEKGELLEREKDLGKEKAFRQLHLALLDALEPEITFPRNYYRFYPFQEDGGYLERLIEKCRENLAMLPSYAVVKDKALHLAGLYRNLQSLKHLSPAHRAIYLEEWFTPYRNSYPSLYWNEFAAAAGSTLGIFALFTLASRENVSDKEIEEIFNGYFPWICGLHILLDYFIDQEEDQREGDLNFVLHYSSPGEEVRRLKLFLEKALSRSGQMRDYFFHRTVVKGLLALYLSDPKVDLQGLKNVSRKLLEAVGDKEGLFLFRICRLLRKSRVI